MHQVCRKYQGLHWEPPRDKGMEANLRALVNVDVQSNPQPMHSDTLAVAFEARSHPKLVGEMTCSSLVLRQKSLQYACQAMSAPREIACFLEADIVESLTMAGRDQDNEVRELTTRALARLAREPNGRAKLLESDSAIALLLKLSHSETEQQEAVRGNCLAAMSELGRDVPCRAALIAAGGVEQLVVTAPGEVEALQPAALAALRGMMMAQPGLEQAIAAGAISAMISLLAAPSPAVREKAALCLGSLTVETKEKEAARTEGGIGLLVGLLESEAAPEAGPEGDAVLTAVLACLASLTADSPGKMAAVEHGAYKGLLPLLERAMELEMEQAMTSATCTQTVHLTKCIANVAEHPKGRKHLQPALYSLRPLAQSAEPLVAKHAESAVAVVTWMP